MHAWAQHLLAELGAGGQAVGCHGLQLVALLRVQHLLCHRQWGDLRPCLVHQPAQPFHGGVVSLWERDQRDLLPLQLAGNSLRSQPGDDIVRSLGVTVRGVGVLAGCGELLGARPRAIGGSRNVRGQHVDPAQHAEGNAEAEAGNRSRLTHERLP